MKARLVAPLAALVLAVALAPALRAEDFRWQGRVAAGAAVEIKGVNGGIHAEPASGSEVEVTAVKRARRGNPDEVLQATRGLEDYVGRKIGKRDSADKRCDVGKRR